MGVSNTNVPLPPRRRGLPRWLVFSLIGCGGLILLTLLVVGGCAALIGGSGGGGGGESEEPADQPAVALGEPVTAGDTVWTVTEARQATELTAEFAEPEQGNFVIVNFDFTNNGSEAVTLDTVSLTLIDSEGRESQADPDKFQYIPEDRNIFLENVNPGVTDQGQAIFTVASDASGFRLQVGDAAAFSDENGYVELGF